MKTGRPTTFMPGSPGKREVLERRYERGEQLFHPKDAGMPRVDRRPRCRAIEYSLPEELL